MRPSRLRHLPRTLLAALALYAVGAACAVPARAQVRVKDIADVEGVRDNQLVGFGLVAGLNGTGDKLDSSVFTRETLVTMLERLGVNTRDQILKLSTNDVAAVLVTANLPAFSRMGERIDVAVSALGDATNLTGGTLMVTPLTGADGQVYAVAQGALTTGAISAHGSGASVTRGVPTAGRIANGAIVEREVPYSLGERAAVHLALRNPDFTTAERVAQAINRYVGEGIAQTLDPRTIDLQLAGLDIVGTLARIEDLRVQPDTPATVVVEEASGTIVMGDNVRISTVAVAQGNLTVRVTESPEVSQPNPFAHGTTVVTPNTDIQVQDGSGRKIGIVHDTATLRDLVASLNALGVGPRDLISILQSIKAAGALQADLQVR